VAALWINTAATNRHFDAQFAESKRVAAETQRLSQENLEGSRREAQARAQREQTESSRRDRELALHKDEYFHRLWGEAMEIAIKPKTQSECLAALTNLKVLASRPAPECCRVEWEDTLTELEGFVSAKLRKLTIASAAAAAAKAANCREGMASNPGNLDVKVADDACRNVSMGTKGDKPWFATVTTTNGTPIQIRCICRNGGKRS
jgi:hypothetical protein